MSVIMFIYLKCTFPFSCSILTDNNLSLNESEMFELAVKIGARWKMIAYDLGFTNREVQDIESQSDENGNQCFQMLQNWKAKPMSNDEGRRQLENALSKGGYKDVIMKLFYQQEGEVFAKVIFLKEYYEIVNEARHDFFPTHADFFTEMHF